jgi:hypothetical protein
MPEGKFTFHKEQSGSVVVADETVYATRDGRLVREDDPEANTLVASAGRPIPDKLVERYGIKATGAQPRAKAEPEEKPAEAQPEKVLGESDRPSVTTRPVGEERPSVTTRPLSTRGRG